MLKKFLIAVFLFLLAATGGFFYFRHQVYFSHGRDRTEKTISISKGENVSEIISDFKEKKIIASGWQFYYYLKVSGLSKKILPGEYELSGKMTIPEITAILTTEKKREIKITFPEGFDSRKMAERLSENGLPGEEFLKLISAPAEIVSRYAFLEKAKNLEGYLFPDTYLFFPNSSAEKIILKMLDNFDEKLSPELREEIIKQKKTIREVVTMASVIEKEVSNPEDRKIVSGIFWNRIAVGQPLQSCATLAYILGVNKKQYTYQDTRINSPYNTYIHQGLPPGPIANPGLKTIEAAVYPRDSSYNYFLSDPETGKTVFSRSLEEHNANKIKYGL